MSQETIAKLYAFVICVAAGASLLNGCSQTSDNGKVIANNLNYSKPIVVGSFENTDIKESSGIAASLCQKGVYWTHNDGGDGPFIFAIDERGGDLGTWRVSNAKHNDWEDIAAVKGSDGKCYLYVGDIGNNDRERTEGAVYRIVEPLVNGALDAKAQALETEPVSALRFRYADGNHNAEALLVEPKSGFIYILTKRLDGPAQVFRLKPVFDHPEVTVAEEVGKVSVPSVPNGLLTGGSASPDGTSVMLCDYSSGWELKLPATAANFDEIWKQTPMPVDLGERKQGEAVSYSPDGRSVIASSEKKGAALHLVTRTN